MSVAEVQIVLYVFIGITPRTLVVTYSVRNSNLRRTMLKLPQQVYAIILSEKYVKAFYIPSAFRMKLYNHLIATKRCLPPRVITGTVQLSDGCLSKFCLQSQSWYPMATTKMLTSS